MIRGATAGSVVTVRIVRTTRRRLLSRAVWQLHVKSGYTTSTNHHSQARRASQFWFRALRSPTPVLFARRTSFRVRSSRHPRAALNGRRAYRLHSRAAWLLTPKPHSLPLAPSTVVREPRAKTKGEGRRATCVKMTSRASGACPLPARSGHSFAPDAPFGMVDNGVEPTLFVGENEASWSLRIADIRRFIGAFNASP